MMQSLLSRFPYLIALFSGGIGVLAFSPFDQWYIAYLSFAGLLGIIKTQPKATALRAAFVWGISFFTIGIQWLNVSIHQFGGAPLWISYCLVVILAAYLALYPLLFAWIIRRFDCFSAPFIAAVWTLTEFLRGWVLTGFPWLQFGYTQIDTPLARLAPILGVQSITFVMVCLCVFLLEWKHYYQWLKTKSAKWISGISILFTGLLLCSPQPVQNDDSRALNITLLQGNIAQNLKWDPNYLAQTLETYAGLIKAHLGKTDVIILPEAALPTLENYLQPFLQSLQDAAREQGTELMIGTVYSEPNLGKLLNSIVVIGHPQQPYEMHAANRYNKHHLVPFGEYVPLEKFLRPLGSVFNLPMSAFEPGAEIQPPLSVKQHHFTAAICYEIILGHQLQQNLRQNTDFLLTVSNDAWFGDSLGPWQHLQMARMRALELGKPLIRATNTGISVFIDGKGKIVAQAPQFMETALTHRIAPSMGTTIYGQYGDGLFYAVITIILGLRLLLKRLFSRSKTA